MGDWIYSSNLDHNFCSKALWSVLNCFIAGYCSRKISYFFEQINIYMFFTLICDFVNFEAYSVTNHLKKGCHWYSPQTSKRVFHVLLWVIRVLYFTESCFQFFFIMHPWMIQYTKWIFPRLTLVCNVYILKSKRNYYDSIRTNYNKEIEMDQKH